MKINLLKSILTIFFLTFTIHLSQAQEDILSQTLWYRVDLKDKTNAPFFTRQTAKMLFRIPNETRSNETINQLMVQGDLIYSLITGLRAGILRPFKNDDLKERMTYEEFTEKLDEKKYMESQDYHVLIIKKVLRFSKSQNQFLTNNSFSKNLYSQMEQSEKDGKPFYYEIEALTILQPNGEPLGTFGFNEVTSNLLLDNEECNYWISKEKSLFFNMFDALNHNLFEAQLIRYQHPKNNKLLTIQNEAETQSLQSLYAGYPAFASKIVFQQSFSKIDVQKVFLEFQKVK
jgi:uncharacterized protein YbcC (UPF0753/DUF2309 family)